jgi:cell wall assembly regulator SMI1
MKTESPEIPKPEPTEESKLEVTFPPPVRKSKQYVEGFDKGQEDAKAEKDEANLTGKSDDFREGYNDGYKSV